MLYKLKVSHPISFNSLKLMEKILQIKRGSLLDVTKVGSFTSLHYPDHVDFGDEPSAELVGNIEIDKVSGMFSLKVIDQSLTVLRLRSRSSTDPVDSILQGVVNIALGIA